MERIWYKNLVVPQTDTCFLFFERPYDIPSLKLTAKAPENKPFRPQKERIVFQPSIFRCYVSFREGRQCEDEIFQTHCMCLVCLDWEHRSSGLRAQIVVLCGQSRWPLGETSKRSGMWACACYMASFQFLSKKLSCRWWFQFSPLDSCETWFNLTIWRFYIFPATKRIFQHLQYLVINEVVVSLKKNHPQTLGKWSNLTTVHIFQMGWFNQKTTTETSIFWSRHFEAQQILMKKPRSFP